MARVISVSEKESYRAAVTCGLIGAVFTAWDLGLTVETSSLVGSGGELVFAFVTELFSGISLVIFYI